VPGCSPAAPLRRSTRASMAWARRTFVVLGEQRILTDVGKIQSEPRSSSSRSTRSFRQDLQASRGFGRNSFAVLRSVTLLGWSRSRPPSLPHIAAGQRLALPSLLERSVTGSQASRAGSLPPNRRRGIGAQPRAFRAGGEHNAPRLLAPPRGRPGLSHGAHGRPSAAGSHLSR